MAKLIGTLDSELKLLRWRLAQVIKERQDCDALELEQVTTTTRGRSPGSTAIRKRPGFDRLILRYVEAITSAELVRQQLLEAGDFAAELEQLRQIVEVPHTQQEEGEP